DAGMVLRPVLARCACRSRCFLAAAALGARAARCRTAHQPRAGGSRRGGGVLPGEGLWENPPPYAQACRRDAASRSTDRAACWTHPAWIGAMALAGFRSGVSALDSPVLVERSVAGARGAACRDRADSSPIRRCGDRGRRFRALGLDRPRRALWIDPLHRRHRGAWRRQAAVPPVGLAVGPPPLRR